jgi:tetratricopeptide (TPR) repeat protein
MGRHDEAIAEIRKALELDPVSLVINTEVGVAYFRARQYDMAIEQVRRTVEMDPGFALAHYLLGDAYGLKGMAEEYANETEKADILAGKPPEEVKQRYNAMRNAFRTAGMKGFWRKEIEFLLREHSLNVLWIAGVYAQINEKDKAFEILEKQYENHDPNLTALKESPYFDPLHDDPRYQDLIRRIGFPE